MGHHEHRKPFTLTMIAAENSKRHNTNVKAAKNNKEKYIRMVLEKEYATHGNSFDKLVYTFIIHDIKALIKQELMPYVESGEIKVSVVKSMMDSITKSAVDHIKKKMEAEKAFEKTTATKEKEENEL